ncbi:Hypothetical_protein [Hexamita inflata]|uniref:Hypothetical_protein n=1 Tax=Hexamita inflata TaxID=28002 RepID=A0AA86N9R3_9EUKA|nr:Hypothetical protein HINF_LOCUS3372 [Hexamita inflata]
MGSVTEHFWGLQVNRGGGLHSRQCSNMKLRVCPKQELTNLNTITNQLLVVTKYIQKVANKSITDFYKNSSFNNIKEMKHKEYQLNNSLYSTTNIAYELENTSSQFEFLLSDVCSCSEEFELSFSELSQYDYIP